MGIVQLLVEKKGDITAKNTAGMTPLHTACNNGHVSTGQKQGEARAAHFPLPPSLNVPLPSILKECSSRR